MTYDGEPELPVQRFERAPNARSPCTKGFQAACSKITQKMCITQWVYRSLLEMTGLLANVKNNATAGFRGSNATVDNLASRLG